MPGLTQDSQAIVRFIADELSPQTYVNIMDQYRPCFQAGRSPEIARRTTPAEHHAVVEMAVGSACTGVYPYPDRLWPEQTR